MARHSALVMLFDKTGRAQRFIDRLQAHWRFIGSVWQIGGPDLAHLNVNLVESATYLAGRLHELFLPSALSERAWARRLRRAQGRDGRWAIDEVFCFNSAWHRTVAQLIGMSDVILIDLRGITTDRAGIRDELVLLARTEHWRGHSRSVKTEPIGPTSIV